MKTKNQLIAFLVTAGTSLLAISSAATLTWDNNAAAGVTGGTGAWSTSATNWTTDSGATNIAWENLAEAPFHDAVFSGTAGTVTVGEAISIKNMTFSNTTGTYSVTGSTLNFTAGTIFMSSANGNSSTASVTTASNISGNPTINTTVTGSSARRYDFTVPANGSMVLGNMVSAVHSSNDHVSTINLGGGSNSTGELGSSLASNGTGVGNRLWFNSGTWTLKGVAYSRDQWINGATVTIATGGQLRCSSREVLLQAGTLNYNNPGAVRHDNTAFDPGRIFRIIGGTINQTSGSAITTSTNNPDMVWGGNFTFSGTNGADSNLFLGNGRISLGQATRTVTVTNAATTLSVGGVISNTSGATPTATPAGSLTKAGAGTLELRGVSTYTGITTITAGTLKMGANNVIANTSNVSIGSATLDADTRTDTAGTLDVTGTATINLGSGAALAFADSKAVDWTGGTINITGTLGATSLRFGDSADDLTSSQLALISVNGSGLGTYVLNANGYLVPAGGGDATPPMLTSITDNVSGGPVTVGSMVTYTVTFDEDMDSATVDASDFNNAGTAAVTIGTITETTPGVFTVQVTPTSAGSLIFRIAGPVLQDTSMNNLVVPLSDDTTITVQTAYDAWAGGALFDADANGDGVKNGLAWILGGANPNAAALDKLPTVSTSAGNMVFTFKRIQASINATTALSIEVGTTLTSWPSVYTVGTDTAGSTPDVVVAKDTPIAGTDTITLTVPQGSDSKKFARLKAIQTP